MTSALPAWTNGLQPNDVAKFTALKEALPLEYTDAKIQQLIAEKAHIPQGDFSLLDALLLSTGDYSSFVPRTSSVAQSALGKPSSIDLSVYAEKYGVSESTAKKMRELERLAPQKYNERTFKNYLALKFHIALPGQQALIDTFLKQEKQKVVQAQPTISLQQIAMLSSKLLDEVGIITKESPLSPLLAEKILTEAQVTGIAEGDKISVAHSILKANSNYIRRKKIALRTHPGGLYNLGACCDLGNKVDIF